MDLKISSKCPILTRRSSRDLGYFKDDYLDFFSTESRSPPLINLTTYLRITSLRLAINKFLDHYKNEKTQLVVLGTGLCTIPFHFLEKYENLVCYDHDFDETMKSKSTILRKNAKFRELLPDLQESGDYVTSERYKMVAFDLYDSDKLPLLVESGLSSQLPTVVVSDFVMNYLKTEASNKVLKWFADYVKGPLLYLFIEPLGHGGRNEFEKVTGWISHSAIDYPNIDSQVQRFKELGWDGAHIRYGSYFFNTLSSSERERVLKIENFTELTLFDHIIHMFILGFAFKNISDSNFFDFLFIEITEVEDNMVSLANEPLDEVPVSNSDPALLNHFIDLCSKPIEHVTF